VDFGPQPGCTSESCDPACSCGRYLEIWNLVFMQYNRNQEGEMKPLPDPSIDTGAGLERLASVIQGVPTTYATDLFTPLLARAQELSGVSLGDDPEKDVSLKVVADHARACAFLIGDGTLSSNEGRGYVLRRILRRASRHGVLLGIEEPFLHRVADVVIDEMASAYPELGERRAFVIDRIKRDEERFLQTLSRGLALLEEEIRETKARSETVLAGGSAFRLYDTFGFPLDLTADILRGESMTVDQAGFESAMQEQRARARAAWKGSGDETVNEVYTRIAVDLSSEFVGYGTLESESVIAAILVDGVSVESAREGQGVELIFRQSPFYAESGGQVGDRGGVTTANGRVAIDDTKKPLVGLVVHVGRVLEGEVALDAPAHLRVDPELRAATVRNHSGTHLLHAALRKVVGPQAMQKGSLVSSDRLRFDFTHDSPLTPEEIEAIEDLANEWIESNAAGTTRLMAYSDAVEAGAIAIFEEKYGDEVRVVSFGDFSTELCGGTHVSATGEIGVLKIVSETGIASGVRRIEAVTGMGAVRHMRLQEQTLARASDLLKGSVAELPRRIERLLDERKESQRVIEELRAVARGEAVGDLASQVREIGGVKALAVRADGTSAKELRSMVDDLRAKLGSGVVMIGAES
jgi:alanyl-tRNA synthetase